MLGVPENTLVLPPRESAAHPARIAAELARDRDRWAHLLRYDPDERYAVRVAETADAEVWLLSWLPGQSTPLHDHGGAAGAFTVVAGAVTELVARGRGETRHEVRPGSTRVFGPGYVHRVANRGADPAVSIHVYRPARAPMREYVEDPVHGPVPAG